MPRQIDNSIQEMALVRYPYIPLKRPLVNLGHRGLKGLKYYIGWHWDGGIEVSISNDEVTGTSKPMPKVLPWLQ